MKKNYIIEIHKSSNITSYEEILFQAYDLNGKQIFGASATIIRGKSLRNNKWGEWKINYGTSGAKDYKSALPYVDVINKAMSALKRRKF